MGTFKLVAIVVAALALMAGISHVSGKMKLADALVEAAREATDNPQLPASASVEAVKALGADRDELARVQQQLRDEATLSDENRANAARASKMAAQRIDALSATSRRLDASAAAGGGNAGDCDASPVLLETWK